MSRGHHRRPGRAAAVLLGALALLPGTLATPGSAAVRPTAAGEPDAVEARAAARDILGDARFREPDVPRPLRDPLRRLGEWLDDLFGDPPRPEAPDPPAEATGDGGGFGLTGPVVVLVVVLVVAVLAWWLVTRRRSAGPDEDGGAEAALAPTDADGLERAADEAEAAGDLEGAIRLRFRAGLLRLDDAGAVAFRPSLTTGQVARALRLGAFETVGSTHDTVVYGRRPATGDDVERTRRGWEQVLGHVGAAPGRGDGA